MKKISTLFIKRLFPLLIFMAVQIRVWATDSTTASSIDRGKNIFLQPWIWIGVSVLTVIILLGPFTDKTEKFVIVRKKSLRRKEDSENNSRV